MSKIISTLPKIWLKVINIENSLFPQLQEKLGVLSTKKQKLIKILDFAEIEKMYAILQKQILYNATDATKIPLREKPVKVDLIKKNGCLKHHLNKGLSISNTTNALEGGVFSHMKNMISLHRGLSKSLKLNLVDYYLVNHKKK